LIRKGRRPKASSSNTISSMKIWTKVTMKTVMNSCLSRYTNLPLLLNKIMNQLSEWSVLWRRLKDYTKFDTT
jgi:hypothetical protein